MPQKEIETETLEYIKSLIKDSSYELSGSEIEKKFSDMIAMGDKREHTGTKVTLYFNHYVSNQYCKLDREIKNCKMHSVKYGCSNCDNFNK